MTEKGMPFSIPMFRISMAPVRRPKRNAVGRIASHNGLLGLTKKKIATAYANKAQIGSIKYVRAPGCERKAGYRATASTIIPKQRPMSVISAIAVTIRRTIPMTWLRS